MFGKKTSLVWGLLAVATLWGGSSAAQIFALADNPSSSVQSATSSAWRAPQPTTAAQKQTANSNQTRSVNTTARQSSTGGQPGAPTADGALRGRVAIRPVADNGMLTNGDENIFLFYDNFSINKTLGGVVRCNVRFVVLTTLNSKLSNLSVKLKWPNMLTSLSFNDVNPNVENYFDYTLLGDGCYSMDKIPNIIVNRCRVSKMSQEACAAKIRWLKKG